MSGPWVTRNEPLRRTVGPQSPLALAPDVACAPALMELPSAAQPMQPGRSRILNSPNCELSEHFFNKLDKIPGEKNLSFTV